MDHSNVTPQVAAGLLELQKRIKAAKILPSKLDETLNLATWNIREFGKKKRTEAAIHYIAEILGQFDLIGVTELRDDLTDLKRVLDVLGPTWRAVYSDMIPDRGGNSERIAYVYDKRAVTFNGLAAEANAPRSKEGTEYHAKIDWWRAPYMASFRSGNFDMVLITAHIRWGDSDDERIPELQLLADWVDAKAKDAKHEDKDIFILGDFNIPKRGDALFKAITSKGLESPKALIGLEFGSNLERNQCYDQILQRPIYPDNFTNDGGIVDFYSKDIEPLFPGMEKTKFTYQMSDHLPLWMQINIDIAGQQLEQLIRG
jgi:hypothetical protein